MKKSFFLFLYGILYIPLLTSAQMNTQKLISENSTGYFITDFGAIGDGKTLCTQFFQKAIDNVAEKGGGMVIVPTGKFLTGTIVLKNNVILYLSPGSTLIGSTNIDDYPEIVPSYRSYTDNYSQRTLIYAEKQSNIGITGYGKIYGNGEHFKEDKNKKYKLRPYLVRFVECKDVNLEGVTYENGAMWTIHLLACENVHCSGIRIYSRCNHNNDGIDIDSCENVIVSDCHIVSGDDSIVLKSTSPKPCKNITITNCIVSSLSNGIKMGTESNGGFQNISISNCSVYDTKLSGLTIQTVDGGITENIVVTNLTMQNVGCPIFIRLGNRARPCCPNQDVPSVGTMRKINISNIIATGCDTIGCAISGIPEHYIDEVNLSNINLSFQGGIESPIAIPEEKEEAYPEYRMFGTLPAYGFFIRHTRNIHLDNITLRVEQKDIRPALFLTDVKTSIISNLHLFNESEESKPIIFNDSSNINIEKIHQNGILQQVNF